MRITLIPKAVCKHYLIGFLHKMPRPFLQGYWHHTFVLAATRTQHTPHMSPTSWYGSQYCALLEYVAHKRELHAPFANQHELCPPASGKARCPRTPPTA